MDIKEDASLAWLWQTVAATCCWALSDVICDACIRPPSLVESEPPTPSEEPKKGLRRRRPEPLSRSAPPLAPLWGQGGDLQEPKGLRRIKSPRLRPCTQLLPEVVEWSLDEASRRKRLGKTIGSQ